MTYLDAAYEILKQAREALHYQQITERALAQGFITPQGLTPEATMASRLYTDTLQETSRFTRAGKGVFGLAQWQPSGIEAQVREINQATRDQLKQFLHSMPPDRFEALVGELLIQMGFDEGTVTATRRSGDGGIDVVGVYRAAGLTEVNAAVQVKRWKGNVRAPVVTQLRGSLQVHQQGIIITTSGFSKGAQTEAAASNKTRISLINGEELLDLLVKHKVGVVERNLKVISLDDEWWGELAGETPPPALEPTTDLDTEKPLPKPKPGKKAGQKPTGFVLFGETYEVDTWRGLLLKVCEVLAQLHPDNFAEVAVTVKGRTRQHIAPSPNGMINPMAIAGTDLWLEANQSKRSALRVVELALEAFGHEPSELQFEQGQRA